jgi:hypothetical protein
MVVWAEIVKRRSSMKKLMVISLIIFGFSVYNVSLATATCNIVKDGSNLRATNETSRTPVAAEEFMSAWAPVGVCDEGPPPWCSSSWESQCYIYTIGSFGGCRYSACLDGTWEVIYYSAPGQPTSRTTGSWDVVCDTTTTTTTTVPSTIINLSSFTAIPKAGKIIVKWSTESEIDNAGFNIYSSESKDGEFIKINDALIPAQGFSTEGATYEFIDSGLRNGKTYYYKLEDIDLNGTSTMHGPVSATSRWFLGIFSIFGK